MKAIGFTTKSISLLAGATLMATAAVSHADSEAGLNGGFLGGGTIVYVFNKTPQAGGTARCFAGSPFGIANGMQLDISNDGGKALYAGLLAAEVAGKSVIFNYSYNSSNGSCTLGGAYY